LPSARAFSDSGQANGGGQANDNGKLTTASPRPAQLSEGSSPLIRVTPVAGAAFMSLKNNAGEDVAKPDTGLTVGGLADIGRGIVTFQTGLLYNQFGGLLQTPNGSEVVGLDYLSIPLVAKLNAMRNPDRTIYLKGGLMPSFLLDSRQQSASQATADFTANGFDVAAVAGVGVALPVSRINSLIIDAQYVHSLNEVNDSLGVHNEGFMITAGVSIAF
jgi:hypothetical protein